MFERVRDLFTRDHTYARDEVRVVTRGLDEAGTVGREAGSDAAAAGEDSFFAVCADDCADCQREARDYYTRQADLAADDDLKQTYQDKAERAAQLGPATHDQTESSADTSTAAATDGDGASDDATDGADDAAGSEPANGDTRSDEESEQFQRDYHQAARDYNTAALEMHNAEMRQLHLDDHFYYPDEILESQAEIYCAVPDVDEDTDTAAG